MLIVMCGLPATGKTTIAKKIAKDIGMEILHTDMIRRELFKKCSYQELLVLDNIMSYDIEYAVKNQNLSEKETEKYQELISKQKEMVYDALFDKAFSLLSEGRSVLLDGTFYKRNLRERAYSIAHDTNHNIYVVECVCTETEIEKRLQRRKYRKDELSNAEEMRIYYMLKDQYENPYEDGVPLITVDTNNFYINEKNTEKTSKMELISIIKSIKKIAKNYGHTDTQV